MKRFIVEIPIRGFETYIVKASTEKHAIELIKSGDAERVEQHIEDTYYEHADISIER